MPKSVQKSDLPQKICPVCGRLFTWRKKWEKNWETVKYCSDRCRKKTRLTTDDLRLTTWGFALGSTGLHLRIMRIGVKYFAIIGP